MPVRTQAVIAAALTAAAAAALAPGVPLASGTGGQTPAGGAGAGDNSWKLVYAENFSAPLNEAAFPWIWDGYTDPFDTVMDDAGLWYRNDYGPAWETALNSFATWRKEFPVGQDGWLTASLSARDWNRDGVMESPPSLTTREQNGVHVAVLEVPDHTGGIIFRPTDALPLHYRIEYKLMTIDFGGKRHGALEYDGRINGYDAAGCKTQHPWGEGSRTRGWTGDASVPYCEWQDVREGVYGYNGFHFLAIVDFADPAPRNNHFWHYRRKVLMDVFAQHPDRVGAGSGGRVCNSAANEYYAYRDSSFNIVNMSIAGLPHWAPNPGGLPGNPSWFMTDCSGGVAERPLSSAAEMQPELMPDEFYTFAIERDLDGYTLEVSGNFVHAGREDDSLPSPVHRGRAADLALQQRPARVRRAVQRRPRAERRLRQPHLARPVAGGLRLSGLLHHRRPLHERLRGNRHAHRHPALRAASGGRASHTPGA